jgi:hypothetical protein
MEIAKVAKKVKQFECQLCNYITHNHYDYKKHCMTIKHSSRNLAIASGDFSMIKNNKEFVCDICSKTYKDNSGLWKHKKICKKDNVENKDTDTVNDDENALTLCNHFAKQITPELILNVLQQNKDILSQTKELTTIVAEQNKTIMDFAKNGKYNVANIQNINSHNKTFNLQFFLNETCKDAMNINDFVDSIKLQLSDLENVGKVGFVEGISSIILKNLKALDVHKRPVHCADKKREVIYIKDENKWEKDSNKNKIRLAIKKIAIKNERLLSKYKEQHPGCNFSASKYADQYSKIVIEAMGGIGNDTTQKEDRIIQKIAHEVVIDKIHL